MKLISHLLLFLLGGAVGVYWGVNHPDLAAKEQLKINAAVSQAKIELLQRFNSGDTKADYQHMLSDEQQKLAQAKQQIGN
jgi:hypothetical protein